MREGRGGEGRGGEGGEGRGGEGRGGEGRGGEGRAGQGRAGQGRAGQGRAGQGRGGEGRGGDGRGGREGRGGEGRGLSTLSTNQNLCDRGACPATREAGDRLVIIIMAEWQLLNVAGYLIASPRGQCSKQIQNLEGKAYTDEGKRCQSPGRMKNSSYYIAPVGLRTHDRPHTVASNMTKSHFYVGSMYDDIRLHVARSYTSSADSPFSLMSSFTLSNHLLLGLPLFLLPCTFITIALLPT